MSSKYIIFKDDDVGKDLPGLKKWVNIVLKNNAKGSIGLIGKYLKNQDLREYLNSLNKDEIEVFCHGYSHSYLPFLISKKFGRNRFYPTEFDRNEISHNRSLKKYRYIESKYLKNKAVTFGPPGNLWNDTVIEPLILNDFKLMFSWRKVGSSLFAVPLTANLKQNSLKEFIDVYEHNRDDVIFTIQFHHANLTSKQFQLISEVIDFLKNNESRVFILPSDLLKIFSK